MPRFILILSLFLIGGLAILSVFGAFLGADKASAFFNSFPMTILWLTFIGILMAGFFYFRRLLIRPFLFLIHVGCLFVLLGGLWGSRTGLAVRGHFLKSESFYKGMIPLYEGEGSSGLYDIRANPVGSLPFEVFLDKFQVHYYDNPQFLVRDKTNPKWFFTVPVKPEEIFDLGNGIQFCAVRFFRNLQIQIQEESRVAEEGPSGVINPGYQVQIYLPDGSQENQYIFEHQPMHSLPRYRFEVVFQPSQMPSAYISELIINENGQETARKRIEVNRPLFYKGYLFYQQSWGQDSHGHYSIIGVSSNSGLSAVFAGYGLLTAGLIGQLWIVPAAEHKRKKEGSPCSSN